MSSKLYLKIGEVAVNIFIDDCISIPIFLVNDADKLCTPGDHCNKVTVTCRVDGGNEASKLSHPHFDLDADSCIIRPNGTGTLRITFRSVSMDFENKKFILSFNLQNDVRKVLGTQTQPLFVISNQLVLTEDFIDTYTWYKDEGGKDKSIEYGVHMIDRQGSRVRGRKVALMVTFIYLNGHLEPHQNIMTVMPDSKLVIDERSGSAIIRIRINEVSTRHQGQLFQVLISPDIAVGPSNADVCPVTSVAVDVKSKRNHHKERDRDLAHRVTPAAVVHKVEASLEPPVKKLRQTSEESFVSTRSSGSGIQLADHQCIHDDGIVIDNCHCKSDGIHFSSPVDFNTSVGNLVLWAKSVMKGMDEIQWKQVGYSVSADGAPDVTKPLFNISNPHETITNIVQEYAEFIQPSLQFLGHMADSSSSSTSSSSAHGCGGFDDKLMGMLSCIDMWAPENMDDVSILPLTRGASFRASINIDPLALSRNHSLFLDGSSHHHTEQPLVFPPLESFFSVANVN
jgi:hypothetical protein